MAVTATKFASSDVAAACRVFGPSLKGLPAGVVGANLLWAICGNESSYGVNCVPRHEPAYDVGGMYAAEATQAALLLKYGPAAACSYGPMQVMLCNAPASSAPDDFNDLSTAIRYAVFALNSLLARFKPTRIAEVGYCYNGGHIANPNPAAKNYGTRLAARYLGSPMPGPPPTYQKPSVVPVAAVSPTPAKAVTT
jgi:hypothetical protein